MKRYVYGILALCLPVEAAVSQSDVNREIQDRLFSEQDALNQVVLEIDSEKREILRNLEQVENNLRKTERSWKLMTARNQTLGDPSLQAPLKAQVESIQTGLNHLQQFNQGWTDYLHPAEAEQTTKRRGQVVSFLTLSNSVIATDESLQTQVEFMNEAITRLESLAGGHMFDSEALDDEESWSAGQIWLLGPVAFFKPTNDGVLSWISHSSGDRPATASLKPPEQEKLRDAFTGRSGKISLPADPAMPYQRKTGLSGKLAEVAEGGIWIIPILGFAFLATVSAILKWLELRRYKPPPDEELCRIVLESNNISPLDKQPFTSWSQPVRHIVEKGIRLRESDDPKLEAKLVREVYLLHPELTRYLSFIAITASVAPLLGLLGTVSGMIETFDVISIHGTRNAQMLSGGISEALITTEFGLIVAIPALVLHTLLNRRIRRLMSQLEHLARTIAGLEPKGRE